MIRARAPVRVDFAGGWTDVALFAKGTPGAVVNAAISIHSYASVQAVDAWRTEESRVQIYSADLGKPIEAEDIRKLEYDGNLDLVKAAVRHLEISEGFKIITRSDAPPGSGLGTSAAMGVALIGALSCFTGTRYLSYEMAEMASRIEREELGILGGKQDQYASALGGINFMEFEEERVRFASMNLGASAVVELEKHLVLCYTGKSRLSGDIHQKVREAYQSKDSTARDAIESLKAIAREMKNALLTGDLQKFSTLMNENWSFQKKLHPSVTNEQIEELFRLAFENGAAGGKACGAGGGGCLLFMAKPDREHKLRQSLQNAGVRVLDFVFDFSGLIVAEAL